MRRSLILAGLALLALSCDREQRTAMEQGRAYTDWFYQGEFDKLWERFSPELRQSFVTTAGLASFGGQLVKELGPEQGAVTEAVTAEGSARVYSRTATFSHAPGPVVMQWAISDTGTVTGLVVRPAPAAAPTAQ